MTDVQRAAVYRAEDAWAARLDAARRGAPGAVVAGSAVVLPGERRLGSLQAAADYLAAVLALPSVRAAFGDVPPPRLRSRRGAAAAHWEPPGVVALPVPAHGEPWALRESVLLHELTHQVCSSTGRPVDHGPGHPEVMLVLVEAVLGPEAAFALRVAYGEERVQGAG